MSRYEADLLLTALEEIVELKHQLTAARADAEALAQELVSVAHQADFGQGLELCWCAPDLADENPHTESLRIRAALANHAKLVSGKDVEE